MKILHNYPNIFIKKSTILRDNTLSQYDPAKNQVMSDSGIKIFDEANFWL